MDILRKSTIFPFENLWIDLEQFLASNNIQSILFINKKIKKNGKWVLFKRQVK